jgi:hypothetical protein
VKCAEEVRVCQGEEGGGLKGKERARRCATKRSWWVERVQGRFARPKDKQQG